MVGFLSGGFVSLLLRLVFGLVLGLLRSVLWAFLSLHILIIQQHLIQLVLRHVSQLIILPQTLQHFMLSV